VVWAGEDRLAPPGLAETFAQGIANAHLTTIARAGHAILLEQPQRVAAVVTQFLQRKQ
jgi:pimeloyl-ACP methyl ester carboxylesterase